MEITLGTDPDDSDEEIIIAMRIITPPPYKGFADWNPQPLTYDELEIRLRDGRLNAVEDCNLTPLCRAIYQQDRELTEKVLACEGVDVNALNEDDNTQLAFTAEHFPTYLDLLLKHPDIDVNLPDCFGYPPIYAVIKYAPRQLPLMLAHTDLKLDVALPNRESLLHVAVRSSPECIMPLITAGVDTSGIVEYATINSAISIPLLLDAGVSFSLQDYMNCMFICFKQLLRATTFDANIRFGGSTNDTFLMQYIKLNFVIGEKVTIEQVLEHCPDVNASDNDGKTAFMYAATCYPSALRALVAHGADVNARVTSTGRTAVHLTAEGGVVEHVRAVLASAPVGHVDISLQDNDGNTAWDVAKLHHPENEELLGLLSVSLSSDDDHVHDGIDINCR
jgi:ankyrin repeat protein